MFGNVYASNDVDPIFRNVQLSSSWPAVICTGLLLQILYSRCIRTARPNSAMLTNSVRSSHNALRSGTRQSGSHSRCQAAASPAAVITDKVGAHTVRGIARKRNEDTWDIVVRQIRGCFIECPQIRVRGLARHRCPVSTEPMSHTHGFISSPTLLKPSST